MSPPPGWSLEEEEAYQERLRVVKRKVRSDLKLESSWQKQGFASHVFDVRPLDNVPRVRCRDLTTEDFLDRFERPYRPCLISHTPNDEGWVEDSKWSFDALERDFGQCRFRVGDDDDGHHVKMSLRWFMRYLREQRDDSPMYIFDDDFGDKRASEQILSYYKVPRFFTDDLFKLAGERKRPPYRWFLVGPERSGSTVHKDPLGTSAWNTLLRYAFFFASALLLVAACSRTT